jgi:hypothetical protein
VLYDRYYDAARAAEECRLAMASINLKVRAIHLGMAARYDDRAKANIERWPAAEFADESEGPRIGSVGGSLR